MAVQRYSPSTNGRYSGSIRGRAAIAKLISTTLSARFTTHGALCSNLGMPFVKYAECQQPASTTAATCPNCGASVKRKSSFSPVRVALVVIGLITAGVI
jgi:hypothetical protein